MQDVNQNHSFEQPYVELLDCIVECSKTNIVKFFQINDLDWNNLIVLSINF